MSSGTGPAAAHTGDKYLYIEGSDQGPQEKTVFTTHKIFNSGEYHVIMMQTALKSTSPWSLYVGFLCVINL